MKADNSAECGFYKETEHPFVLRMDSLKKISDLGKKIFAVWAIEFSVYGTQKPVHCTQNSVYVPWKIWANFVQNVEFSFRTKNQNSCTFQGFRW